MDNIHIRTDPAGNIKADKEKSTEKIDGAVATIFFIPYFYSYHTFIQVVNRFGTKRGKMGTKKRPAPKTQAVEGKQGFTF